MIPNIRFALAVIAAGVFVGLAGTVWMLNGKLFHARAERDAAIAELHQAHDAIDALAAEVAAAQVRAKVVRSARESILTAPPEADAPVAPVIWDALRAADEIGGVR